MTVHRAAEISQPADCDLDRIGVVEVPDVWPPLDATRATIPALAGGTRTVDRARPAAAERSWPQQFGVLLAETLAGARPVQQILPLLSKRGSVQLHRLLPRFSAEHRPRVLRVLTTMPSPDVVVMTMVVLIGPRARALAVRLERAGEAGREQAGHGVDAGRPEAGAGAAWPDKPTTRWLCTDIEAG